MIRWLVVALAFAASSPSLAQGASVATIVVPTGLDDDDAKKLHARIDAQVTAAGGAPLALSSSLEVKAECLDDPSCARALLRAADAPWLLWVEALRAGPKVQIDARLLDAEGRTVKEGGGVVDLEDILKGRAAVPADVLAALSRTEGTASEITPPPKEKPAPKRPPKKLAKAKAPEPAPVTTTQAALPPPIAIAGVAVAAAGAGVTVVCLALIPGQLDVINDATSLGIDKENAAILVPTLAVFSVGGIMIAAAGGAMVFLASE